MATTKLFLLTCTIISLVEIVKTDYIAAVVEFQPRKSILPNQTVQLNLDEYIFNIDQARHSSAQIIVFPEYGLTGMVTDPTRYAIEIPNVGDKSVYTNEWILVLSNAAVGHAMYIVVNLFEKEITANNTLYYNTNIVFDKSGTIIAKHRKINLYSEPELTPGSPSQNQNIFVTDFGITFGLFTCNDIVYYNPSRSILSNNSVTDIVFPTAWQSSLPFFHSLSIQSGYAAATKVNLLAANLNSVEEGIGGSGIYDSTGNPFVTPYISGVPGTKLIVATVKNAPVRDNSTIRKFASGGIDDVPTLANFSSSRYFESKKYEFRKLNLSQPIRNEEVCHRTFCCVFNIKLSEDAINPSDIYQIMAYKGPVRLGEVRHVKICALVACETIDINTCGNRNIQISSRLESILVETNTPEVSDEFYQPFSVKNDLLPVANTVFNSTVNNTIRTSKYYLATNINQQNILAFGIMGNISSGVSLGFNFVLFFGVLVFNYMLH